ncbi:MAG: hypothetical protein ABI851_16445 [Saprospiraceae bacterium]
MAHFTYADTIDKECLKQGDVLIKTADLSAVIDEVHPYFKSNNYPYFLVITQSCDLVKRRDDKCKSRYITIAAIRSLEDALKREAEELAVSNIEKITKKLIDPKNSSKLSEFLSRLFNNNEPDYFYLHHDVSRNFVDPSVAFLRVSIALKSEIHYNVCIKSKVLELQENFQAKLGWLVGNLYSRVGTEDWVPSTLDKSGFEKLVRDQLKTYFQIVPNLVDIENQLKEDYTIDQLKNLPINDLIEIVNTTKIRSKKDKVISKLEEIITNSSALRQGYDIKKLLSKIGSDPSITSLLK